MSGIYDALQRVKQKKERESSTKHPDNVEKAKREQAFFDRLLQKMKEKKEMMVPKRNILILIILIFPFFFLPLMA